MYTFNEKIVCLRVFETSKTQTTTENKGPFQVSGAVFNVVK